MHLIYRHILFLMFLILIASPCRGTHNRAGEISFIQISDFSIQATITTYTKASSTAADRDSLIISWGDGSFSTVLRSNGSGEILSNNTKRNFYTATHTYPGRSTYRIGVMDPNRVDNILNVDPPNSVNIPFYIQTTVTLLNLQFQSPNRSVQLLQAPIDFACVGVPFQHNPAAFDPDGDSLSFEFTVPLMDLNTPVPNYTFPNQINPGINNVISLDPQKGTFNWVSPQKAGEYNIAFIIHEYRKGVKIASTIRDMQIFVRPDCSQNNPPKIASITDTCIIAGTVLELMLLISDPDTSTPGSRIKVEASGAPFFSNPKMIISAPNGYQDSPFPVQLKWNTDCSLVRKEYYTIVIKATDDILDTTGISTLHTIRIKISGPSPENLQSFPDSKAMQLTWAHPYFCTDFKDHFKGFSVWRKEGSLPLGLDTCNPGLQGSQYTQIAYLVSDFDGNNYKYKDTTLLEGKFYCYRVQAEFAITSQGGFPVNFVSGLHSNESCNSLPLNIPVLFNVDVVRTDIQNGEIFLRWTKPLLSEFDTTLHKPPYKTSIYSKTNQTAFSKIVGSESIYQNYSSIDDTTFTHQQLNTAEEQYSYYVELISATPTLHLSDSGDMVQLKINSSDKSLDLSWKESTPWTNFRYDIMLYDPVGQKFDSIASTTSKNYKIKNLVNGNEYCTLVRTFGEYGVSRFESPLINHSNIVCAVPIDNVAPCCPVLRVSDPCNEDPQLMGNNIINTLRWDPPEPCPDNDIAGFNLYGYYRNKIHFIANIGDPQTRAFEHTVIDSIPECYLLRSYDQAGNECVDADSVCINYCPVYNLPNTFTPNNDGHNDLFKPYAYRFVDQIDFKVFNRWGNLIFETKNPEILWNGNTTSGNKVPDGTYYYTCSILYSGIIHQLNPASQINGFIELRRGTN
ncbi:MAG: gliding motility-associated C-terminal domain-containing protein [Saprospiraceae bacterium]|nr:gliding motility-associated C-terminal domain-containing protein [Saprospiraceae bacterium]